MYFVVVVVRILISLSNKQTMKDIPTTDRVMRTRNRSANNSSSSLNDVQSVKKISATNKVKKTAKKNATVPTSAKHKSSTNKGARKAAKDDNLDVNMEDSDENDEQMKDSDQENIAHFRIRSYHHDSDDSNSQSEDDDDDEDDEDEEEEDDNEEDNDDIADVMENITSMFNTATKLDQIKSDQYFLAQSKKPKTSNESFTKLLDNFDLKDDEIDKLINVEYKNFCKNFKIKPFSENDYKKLYVFLTRDLNIILYGPGSKRDLLNSFGEKYLSDHYYFSINGFMDNFKVRDFMEILNETMEVKNPIYDENELFSKMNDFYKGKDIVFLIHSIDLLFTKNPKIKDFLYNLFMSVPNVRIVATVDHVNSALLWSLTEQTIFRWLWVQKDTHQSYFIERKYSSSHKTLFSTSSKSWQEKTNLEAISQVYKQVNRNSQQIFLMIVKHHLESKNKSYPFHILYSDCREEFLVNSEVTLRQHLKEFEYHHLIRISKSSNGVESIDVTIEKDTCQRFLSSIEDN